MSAKVDSLNAILRTTTKLVGDPKRALVQMHSAADAVASALCIDATIVRAFVADQTRNLVTDGEFAS